VREAAAVASPDELRGNVVKAFIVLAAPPRRRDPLRVQSRRRQGVQRHLPAGRACLPGAAGIVGALSHRVLLPLRRARGRALPPVKLDPNEEPVTHYSERVDTVLWPLERI
jgi:hypothetical protein